MTGEQLLHERFGFRGPAFTRARLTRHPLFGALDERRFADVLRWAQQDAT